MFLARSVASSYEYDTTSDERSHQDFPSRYGRVPGEFVSIRINILCFRLAGQVFVDFPGYRQYRLVKEYVRTPERHPPFLGLPAAEIPVGVDGPGSAHIDFHFALFAYAHGADGKRLGVAFLLVIHLSEHVRLVEAVVRAVDEAVFLKDQVPYRVMDGVPRPAVVVGKPYQIFRHFSLRLFLLLSCVSGRRPSWTCGAASWRTPASHEGLSPPCVMPCGSPA